MPLPAFSSGQEAIKAYLETLAAQRKLSGHTVSNYRRDLERLHQMADGIPLEKLTYHQIRHFTSRLHAEGLSPRSIARKLSAWRGFYQWLAEQTGLASNPVKTIKAPRRKKTLPKALSVEDAVQLAATTPEEHSPSQKDHLASLCDHAMFELLYSSGLRVSELTGLDIRPFQENGYTSPSWLDLEEQEIIVTGKGNKKRRVPVGLAAVEAIKTWLHERNQLVKPQETDGQYALFINRHGRRMSPRMVQIRLKAHAKKLGLPMHVHPHVLRHSFASHVLQSSGDLRAVQEMLGHASIASTQVYTALDFQHLARIYDAAHPRAKKK